MSVFFVWPWPVCFRFFRKGLFLKRYISGVRLSLCVVGGGRVALFTVFWCLGP